MRREIVRQLRVALGLEVPSDSAATSHRQRHHRLASTRKTPSCLRSGRPREGVGEVIVVDGLLRIGRQSGRLQPAPGSSSSLHAATGEPCSRDWLRWRRRSTIVLFIDGDGSDRPEMIPPCWHRSRAGAPTSCSAPGCGGSVTRAVSGIAQLCRPPRRFPHPPGLRRALHRHVAVPGHPPRRARSAGHGREDLRVESGNADAGRGGGPARGEIPVGQRRRAGGVSKVSGDWRSAALAAWVLVRSFWRLAWQLRQKTSAERRACTRRQGRRRVGGSSRSSDLRLPSAWPATWLGATASRWRVQSASAMNPIGHLIPRQRVPDLSLPLAGGGSWRLSDQKPRAFHDAGLLSWHALLRVPGLSRPAAVDACGVQQAGGHPDRHIRPTAPSARARPRQGGGSRTSASLTASRCCRPGNGGCTSRADPGSHRWASRSRRCSSSPRCFSFDRTAHSTMHRCNRCRSGGHASTKC